MDSGQERYHCWIFKTVYEQSLSKRYKTSRKVQLRQSISIFKTINRVSLNSQRSVQFLTLFSFFFFFNNQETVKNSFAILQKNCCFAIRINIQFARCSSRSYNNGHNYLIESDLLNSHRSSSKLSLNSIVKLWLRVIVYAIILTSYDFHLNGIIMWNLRFPISYSIKHQSSKFYIQSQKMSMPPTIQFNQRFNREPFNILANWHRNLAIYGRDKVQYLGNNEIWKVK